jgi:hypothetical protein
LMFSWRADGDVIQDMHGVPDGGTSKDEQSFDKRPRRQAQGSFSAPFSGIHGWFWENPGGTTVRVRLTTAGCGVLFVSAGILFRWPARDARTERPRCHSGEPAMRRAS